MKSRRADKHLKTSILIALLTPLSRQRQRERHRPETKRPQIRSINSSQELFLESSRATTKVLSFHSRKLVYYFPEKDNEKTHSFKSGSEELQHKRNVYYLEIQQFTISDNQILNLREVSIRLKTNVVNYPECT